MKPGATALPIAMTSRAAAKSPRSPTATIRSPVIATSALKRGAPVPSNTVASRMIVSQRGAMAISCQDGIGRWQNFAGPGTRENEPEPFPGLGSAAQHGRCLRLRCPVLSDCHAIHCSGVFHRDQSVSDVTGDKVGVSMSWIAHAGATGKLQDQSVTIRNDLIAFCPQRPAGPEFHDAPGAVHPASAPLRRIGNAVKAGVQ